MALTNFKLLFCLLIPSDSTLAQAKCLRTVSELKAGNVKTRWHETTANDGKPLTISIAWSSLLSQKGWCALADRARIRMSFWRRCRDYLVKHQSHKRSPDAYKVGIAFSRHELLMTGSSWQVQDGAEPSLVIDSCQRRFPPCEGRSPAPLLVVGGEASSA
jgi:hypothetical protein